MQLLAVDAPSGRLFATDGAGLVVFTPPAGVLGLTTPGPGAPECPVTTDQGPDP